MKNSELNILIHEALKITERAIYAEMELKAANKAFDLLTLPIFAAFSGQGATLKTLADNLQDERTNNNSMGHILLVESLLLFNAAQQNLCKSALITFFELEKDDKQHRVDIHIKAARASVNDAMQLSLKLDLFIRSIKSAYLLRFFICK